MNSSNIVTIDEWSNIEKINGRRPNIEKFIPKFSSESKLYDMIRVEGFLVKQTSCHDNLPYFKIKPDIYVTLDRIELIYPDFKKNLPITRDIRLTFTAIIKSMTGRICLYPVKIL